MLRHLHFFFLSSQHRPKIFKFLYRLALLIHDIRQQGKPLIPQAHNILFLLLQHALKVLQAFGVEALYQAISDTVRKHQGHVTHNELSEFLRLMLIVVQPLAYVEDLVFDEIEFLFEYRCVQLYLL